MKSSARLETQDEPWLRSLLKVPLDHLDQEIARRERQAHLESTKKNADAIRRRCKTLVGFIREAWHVLEPQTQFKCGWAVEAICQHLEACADGEITRLLINCPPGMAKSLIVSVFFPAWLWGPKGRPSARFLSASYELGLAMRDNNRMRRLVKSEWYQALWDVKITDDQDAKQKFENTATGGRECRASTSLTGGRGDFVLWDDPHSTTTAESDVERQNITQILQEGLPSRGNDDVDSPSVFIIIMQRLHEEDVSGVILSRQLGYVHLRLPMEFEEEKRCETEIGFIDPRTYDGELLFPERWNRQSVDEKKTSMSDYAYAGQYQQRPSPRGGGIFRKDYFEIIDAMPHGYRVTVRGWDLGGTDRKKNKRAARTAGVKLSEYPDGLIVVEDCVAGQWDPGKVEQVIATTASQDGYEVEIDIPQDPGQAGKAQVRYIVTRLPGYTVHWSPESGDKQIRADPVASQAKVGNVKLLRGAWNTSYLEELAGFPSGTWKDKVDATSRAYQRLVKNKATGESVPAAPQIFDPSQERQANGAAGPM